MHPRHRITDPRPTERAHAALGDLLAATLGLLHRAPRPAHTATAAVLAGLLTGALAVALVTALAVTR